MEHNRENFTYNNKAKNSTKTSFEKKLQRLSINNISMEEETGRTIIYQTEAKPEVPDWEDKVDYSSIGLRSTLAKGCPW